MTEGLAHEYLEQMRKAAEDATQFVEGMSEPECLAGRKLGKPW